MQTYILPPVQRSDVLWRVYLSWLNLSRDVTYIDNPVIQVMSELEVVGELVR